MSICKIYEFIPVDLGQDPRTIRMVVRKAWRDMLLLDYPGCNSIFHRNIFQNSRNLNKLLKYVSVALAFLVHVAITEMFWLAETASSWLVPRFHRSFYNFIHFVTMIVHRIKVRPVFLTYSCLCGLWQNQIQLARLNTHSASDIPDFGTKPFTVFKLGQKPLQNDEKVPSSLLSTVAVVST